MTSVVTCPLLQDAWSGHELMVCVLVVVNTDVMLGADVMVGCTAMTLVGGVLVSVV